MTKFPPSISDIIDLSKDGGIFFIYSTERYILLELKRSIPAAVQGCEMVSLDLEESSAMLKEAISLSKEIGFFCTKKVIVLENADVFDEKQRAMLENYMKNPEPNNYLIVMMSEVDKRTKLFKEISAHPNYHYMPYPSKDDLTTFITNELGSITPSRELLYYFTPKVPMDLFHIKTELFKIRLFAESKGLTRISLEQAMEVLTGIGEEVIFKLIDMLVRGDKAKAIKLYRALKISESEQKINPVLISLFFKHFKAILKGKVLLKKGEKEKFSEYLTANKAFYMKSNAGTIIERYKNKKIVQALEEISRIELGMKGVYSVGATDTGILLERFMSEYF